LNAIVNIFYVVNFENCFKALRVCAMKLKSEAIEFLNTYLFRIVSILVDQR
jgi:hypothetical protein